ncbi:MAG: hypothetical protein CL608_33740 [Anaerolineaceae bacterium]|nr:hypothetical protein [Anaerolineaceae bacterium]
MHNNLEFNYKIPSLFCSIMLVIGIGLVTASCSQSKMVPYQFQSVEINYPESWTVEKSSEGLLFQPSEKVDVGITILSNPPEYMEASLQHSLEDFLSTEFLPNLKEVLTSSPVQDSDFNGYPAVRGQVVADLARSEGATYALQFDLILVQHENERALIITHQRGGTEAINEDIADNVESILSSFQFRED